MMDMVLSDSGLLRVARERHTPKPEPPGECPTCSSPWPCDALLLLVEVARLMTEVAMLRDDRERMRGEISRLPLVPGPWPSPDLVSRRAVLQIVVGEDWASEGHPYTCDRCLWGRDGVPHTRREYMQHMALSHPQEVI